MPAKRTHRLFTAAPRAEVHDELAFHLEQRVDEYIARGLSPDAARAAALQRLGDLAAVERACAQLLRAERRAETRRHFMKMSWLDFRLGFRMLVKYPGITVVGSLALALAIAVGALAFELGAKVINPNLPLPDGDRVVALRLWNVSGNTVESQALFDFLNWREQLKSVQHLGAYRNVRRNLVGPGGQATPIAVAEITSSAFSMAGVRPLLGRPLMAVDDQRGAEPVIVIGERLWQQLFDRDPAIIGQTVRLGRTSSTIVGVMPESFGFPIRHTAWTPLRIHALDGQPRKGSPIKVFARLTPGFSLDQAQAELAVIGAQTAVAHPRTHEHIRPQVLPYARDFFPLSWAMVRSMAFSSQLGVIVFIVLVCANVATLVFARTSARESEIVVRSALGASRSRIVSQLLAESLVLGGVAAVIGLAVALFGVRLAVALIATENTVPFWVNDSLSPTTLLYAVALMFLAALITGAVPALKVTRNQAEQLRQAAVGGMSLKFGKLWTGLIIAQVALTVVFLAITLDMQRDAARGRNMAVGFPADEYLSVLLEMDRDVASSEQAEVPYTTEEFTRFRASFAELKRRLEAEPAVAGVTFAQDLPAMYHDRRQIEAEGVAAPSSGRGHLTQTASVGPQFFDVFGARILTGRSFELSDLDTSVPTGRPTGSSVPRAHVVIVNQTFARRVFGAANPIGRRIRYADCQGPNCQQQWYEIVGVTADIAMTGDPDILNMKLGGVYHPWAPGDTYWSRMAVHVRGDARAVAARVRTLAAEVDPSIRLAELRTLSDLHAAHIRNYEIGFNVGLLASGIVLLLSVAGIYAILAFTVARRTREIGIRSALGGNPRRILVSIFSRPLVQVGAGVVLGTILMIGIMGGIKSAYGAMLAVVPPLVMMSVMMGACVVPARRALRIQPTDALKADG